MLLQRCAGRALHQVYAPTDPEYREVFSHLADLLKILHSWQPPEDVIALLEGLDSDQPPVQRQVVPFAIPDLESIAHAAALLDFVDTDLVAKAMERVHSLAPSLASKPAATVVHGDMASGNILVTQGQITAMIDFEWTRMGPPELDLVTLSFLGEQYPSIRPGLVWLEQDYPTLFAQQGFEERLWLYQLAFVLRGVLWWPPETQESDLESGHHLRTLRFLVDRPFAR